MAAQVGDEQVAEAWANKGRWTISCCGRARRYCTSKNQEYKELGVNMGESGLKRQLQRHLRPKLDGLGGDGA